MWVKADNTERHWKGKWLIQRRGGIVWYGDYVEQDCFVTDQGKVVAAIFTPIIVVSFVGGQSMLSSFQPHVLPMINPYPQSTPVSTSEFCELVLL